MKSINKFLNKKHFRLGQTDKDEMHNLLPIIQCCVIKPSTLHTLLTFYLGPETLSEALHRYISHD